MRHVFVREGAAMDFASIEARAFLREFERQPQELRELSIYVLCQTMMQKGLLELKGAYRRLGETITQVYRNPDSGAVFEISKPDLTADDEQAIQNRINELLKESAQAS